jgi:hypothetical protein
MAKKNLPKVFIRWHCPVCKKEQDQGLDDTLIVSFDDRNNIDSFLLWCVDCQKSVEVESGYV